MESIRDTFRREWGYDYDHLCRSCMYCRAVQAGQRRVYKCVKMGISASVATDIRLKDVACKLFVTDEGDTE